VADTDDERQDVLGLLDAGAAFDLATARYEDAHRAVGDAVAELDRRLRALLDAGDAVTRASERLRALLRNWDLPANREPN
jgi:hypothetical protein